MKLFLRGIGKMAYVELLLTKGKTTLVDCRDVDKLLEGNQWVSHSAGYAYRFTSHSADYKSEMMHRLIMDAPQGFDVDHINGDKLDNRRRNLRIASRTLNSMNKATRGAYKQSRGISYSVEMRINGKKLWIGRIASAEEAKHIYDDVKRQIMEVV